MQVWLLTAISKSGEKRNYVAIVALLGSLGLFRWFFQVTTESEAHRGEELGGVVSETT